MGMITTNMMNPWTGANILFKKNTSSTMADARKLVDNGIHSGTVIYTDYQGKGVGRFKDRKWISEKGKNLLATLILDAGALAFPISLLPLAVGLAVSRAMEKTVGVRALVKWPNDVLANGKKCAGILCESYRAMLLVGMGVNCNQTDFPPPISDTATSLCAVTGAEVDMSDFLETLLASIAQVITDKYPHEALQERLAFEGSIVKVMTGLPDTDSANVLEGMLEGIDTEGRLVLRDPVCKTVTKIVSGEIIA